MLCNSYEVNSGQIKSTNSYPKKKERKDENQTGRDKQAMNKLKKSNPQKSKPLVPVVVETLSMSNSQY